MTGPSSPRDSDARSIELATNLSELRSRINAVAVAAGRDADDITVIAVTKTWPADDVRRLAAVGLLDVGENRDQEARAKSLACVDLHLRWHFIGGLQRNKCASVAQYADVIHSIDRLELVPALDQGADRVGRDIDVLIQVNLDPSGVAPGSGRHGVQADEIPELIDEVLEARRLRLAGVMGVAPLGGDAAAAFARLWEASEALRRTAPRATVISAGMSGDWPEAVAAGATHLRLGSAVLGARPPLG